MARPVGPALPPDLLQRLSGGDLETFLGKALLLTTVDEHGRPHPCMLSYGEIVAVSDREVRLATYANSTTTRNIRRDGRMTLVIVDAGVAYYVKGNASVAGELACDPGSSRVHVEVVQVSADAADPRAESAAEIAGGITWRTTAPEEHLARGRAIVAELLRSAGP